MIFEIIAGIFLLVVIFVQPTFAHGGEWAFFLEDFVSLFHIMLPYIGGGIIICFTLIYLLRKSNKDKSIQSSNSKVSGITIFVVLVFLIIIIVNRLLNCFY